jgi:hypothetical protein
MILTIKNADFSAANIGTLSSYIVSKTIGAGAAFDIPSTVDKNSSVNWVITLDEGYTFGTYAVTMNGEDIIPTVVDNVMTISIAEVTGNVRIVVATVNENVGEEDEPVVPPVEPDEPDEPDTPETSINAGLTLYQGYVDNKTVNDVLNTRVKTEALVGPFEIEVNDGYLIRAAYEYTSTSVINGGNLIVQSNQNKTYHKYTGQQYVYITFCKKDATRALSPTEDIVKMFNTDIEVESTPTTDGVEVNGITIKLGQLLDSGLKANNARAYTVQNVNDKTTLTTTGDFVMIPTYDNNDNVSDAITTFYTGTDGKFNTNKQGSLKYHSTINVADLESAAPGKMYRIMFKRNDGNTVDLSELQSSLTII